LAAINSDNLLMYGKTTIFFVVSREVQSMVTIIRVKFSVFVNKCKSTVNFFKN